MNTDIDHMLNLGFYRTIWQSFFENGFWKALMAAFFSLFDVPLEFVVAMPIFWIMDFGSGIYASRRKAREEGRKDWFDGSKLQAQFVKITIHIVLLIGCIILANLFDVEQFITFGFGYIIGNEFFFSTVPHLMGNERAAQFFEHFIEQAMKFMGFRPDDVSRLKDNQRQGE